MTCQFAAGDAEALWKPPSPGSDPPKPAKSVPNTNILNTDPDPTPRGPSPLGLCKQEVTGSIPVGSIDDPNGIEGPAVSVAPGGHDAPGPGPEARVTSCHAAGGHGG